MLDLRGPLTPEHFSAVWNRYHQRWRGRDQRIERIDRAARGEWNLRLNDDTKVEEAHAPNLILTALEDTAESASLVPSVRVKPSKTDPEAKATARKMEQIGTSYLEASEIELLTLKSMMHLSGHGLFCLLVTKKKGEPPRIEYRDPRTCFPEPRQGMLGVTDRCFFARDLYLTQLSEEHQHRFETAIIEKGVNPRYFEDHAVTLVEYYDADEMVVAGVYDANVVSGNRKLHPSDPPNWVSIILDHEKNESGLSPVVIGQRMTLDGEPRGQFDQVIGVMEAHIRLARLVLDYSDQAVYSEIWVKDLIGRMPIGGGSVINLGPNGEIGRLPPAVSSLSVYETMNQLVEGLHLGGRWPKSRPGEIDQSIASAKYLEASVGMMNTVIRTYHLLMRRALKQALRVAFKLDKKSRERRRMAGILRNQQFQIDVDTSKDIDLSAAIEVSYGVGLGRDPAQSMVIGIQAKEAGLVSSEFVQENFDGIEDVQLEQIRIDVAVIREMMFAELMAGVQGGTVPKNALSKIMRSRQDGETIADLYDKYVVEPAEEMQDQLLTSGLTGDQMSPGPAPAGPGGAVPPGPPPEELFAGLLGGGGEEGPETVNRTSIPTGPGSFSGVQTG